MSDDSQSRLPALREVGSRPVRIALNGRVFIGDDEFFYPIEEGSIKVEPIRGRFNKLTVTILVGEVTMEARAPRPPDDPYRPHEAD